jgi:hypothetical protein
MGLGFRQQRIAARIRLRTVHLVDRHAGEDLPRVTEKPRRRRVRLEHMQIPRQKDHGIEGVLEQKAVPGQLPVGGLQLRDRLLELQDDDLVVLLVGPGGDTGGSLLAAAMSDAFGDQGGYLLGIAWLHAERVGSQVVGERLVLRVRIGRRVEDEGDVGKALVLPQRTTQAVPVHPGHEDVGDDDVGDIPFQDGERRCTVTGADHVVPEVPEDRFEVCAIERVVVNDKDLHPDAPFGSRPSTACVIPDPPFVAPKCPLGSTDGSRMSVRRHRSALKGMRRRHGSAKDGRRTERVRTRKGPLRGALRVCWLLG